MTDQSSLLFRLKNSIVTIRISVLSYLESFNSKYLTYSTDIPVFINCRDRVTPLRELVSWLEDEGLHNIVLIDNDSSYPPLLKYFEHSPHRVIRLNENIGHKAPWISGVINEIAKDQAYIVTDPDVIPSKSSHGAIKYFFDTLNKYRRFKKIGFGLRLDDLPDHYELKSEVIQWESQFWKKKIEPDLYIAELDTTFALYRPNTPYVTLPALRTGGRFIARHEPWYIDSFNIPEEISYYRSHANTISGTWGAKKDDTSTLYTR